MLVDDIKVLIEAHIPAAQAFVEGEGCNVRVTVVSPAFEGKSLLQQQRTVNESVAHLIASGALHALSIKSYTPAQWASLSAAQQR
ncbi:MAG: BolA/IbaG family iron-sulfur metabolism protein [Pseudomonadota bacterium]